jgi:hypothetical protein
LDGHEGTIQAIAVQADDDSFVVCVVLQNKQLLLFRRSAGRSTSTSSYPTVDTTSNNTNNSNNTTSNNAIPTKELALANNATTATLLVIADRDPHLYGFTYGDSDGECQRMVQPMKGIFPAVPIDFIVCWYNRRSDDNGDAGDTTTTITTPIPKAALAVLFQDAPYIRCYNCTTTSTMDDDVR